MIDQLRPAFRLTADGNPFATGRVLAIRITDEAGYESDELQIELDDAEPQIARPREGAVLAVALGYEGSQLTEFGTYTVEEFERSGWPRRAVLTAKAADHAKTMKEPKTRAWEGKTLGDVVRAIAAEHGLSPAIGERFASIELPFIAQTEESDQNLLTRLGKRIGAVIAPKDQRLLVTARHSGQTANGQAMPAVAVHPDMLIAQDAYRIGSRPRGRFGSVRVRWRDRKAGLTRNVVVQTDLEGPQKTLREIYQDEADAQRAADAAVREIKAGEGAMTLRLVGTPLARAEAPIVVSGVSLDVDGRWIATRVSHEWNFEGGGATTEIVAEFGADEDDREDASTGAS
ncbi:MAG: hypothetical protein KBG46_08325 [Paracoccus sp.]|nr:hypothetical protein [Paracoccus sp. (in: a-proteobacteria)]